MGPLFVATGGFMVYPEPKRGRWSHKLNQSAKVFFGCVIGDFALFISALVISILIATSIIHAPQALSHGLLGISTLWALAYGACFIKHIEPATLSDTGLKTQVHLSHIMRNLSFLFLDILTYPFSKKKST